MADRDAQEFRDELAASEGSFLAAALDGAWAASRLARRARLMRQACMETENAPTLERWMAAGFYELDTGVGGEGRFVDVPPGVYEVTASVPGHEVETVRFRVDPETTTRFALYARPAS